MATRLHGDARVVGEPDERSVERRAVDAQRSKPASRSGIWEIEHQAAAACPRYEALDRLRVRRYLVEEAEPLEDELSRRLQQRACSNRSDLAGALDESDRVP